LIFLVKLWKFIFSKTTTCDISTFRRWAIVATEWLSDQGTQWL